MNEREFNKMMWIADIATLIEHWNEFKDLGPESELFHIKLDIERALDKAPLTEEEKTILVSVYFSEPQTPVRQKGSGRPNSIRAADLVDIDMNGKSENAKAIYVSRKLKSALEKLVDFLGDEYDGTRILVR